MSPLLPHAEKQLSDPTQRIHKVLETARILYGLIHARYVLTAQGLTDMVRRLALCWLCTRAHARALSCRLVRSLHVSLRALSPLARNPPLPLPQPHSPPPLALPSLYSSPSVPISHRVATKIRPVRSFNLPASANMSCIANSPPPHQNSQKAKYKAHEFGSCPRTLCEKQTVLPTGVSDTASLRCVAREGTPIPGCVRAAQPPFSPSFAVERIR